eukprot:COSAG05_NODE_76_length_21413_cov_40.065122_10_plen_71_part_00
MGALTAAGHESSDEVHPLCLVGIQNAAAVGAPPLLANADAPVTRSLALLPRASPLVAAAAAAVVRHIAAL